MPKTLVLSLETLKVPAFVDSVRLTAYDENGELVLEGVPQPVGPEVTFEDVPSNAVRFHLDYILADEVFGSSDLTAAFTDEESLSIDVPRMQRLRFLAGINIEPSFARIKPGSSQSLHVLGILPNGDQVDVTSSVEWSSSDTGVVSLDGANAGAAGLGKATLTARLDGLKASGQIEVSPWTELTPGAAFLPRDGAGAVVFNHRMWLLGGWDPNIFKTLTNNDVWSSEDGVEWTQELAHAPWEQRHTAGYVVFKGKMWIVGGDANQGHYQNDVWNSADGRHWTQVTNNVPWGPRVLHYTVVFQNKIWVIGGQTLYDLVPSGPQVYYDDVWNSSDGVNWTQVATGLPWGPRGMICGTAVYKNRIWLIGGGTYTPHVEDRIYYNDVWSSADGVNWVKHTAAAPWVPRLYHSVAVYDDLLWVITGADKVGNRNDVWYSSDGTNWQELKGTAWDPRHATSVYVFKGGLWVVTGNNLYSDVWEYVAPPP